MISRSPGSSGESHEYGQPEKYTHLGEPNDPSPIENNGVGTSRDLDPVAPHPGQRRRQSHTPRSRSHHSELTTELYDVPNEYSNLNEVGSPLPVENPDERPVYSCTPSRTSSPFNLGTLARLGLESLTFYIGAPVTFATFDGVLESSSRIDDESNREGDTDIGATARKPVPLFIGLSTGFCGSLTTFSSFMRDVFLALSNSLPVPQYYSGESSEALAPRGVGVDIMALLAVILTTLCVCLSALKIGAHIAILLNRRHIELPFRLRVILDRCALLLGFGTWLGAVLIAVFPPDRPSDANGHDSRKRETWRGQGLFAVVFAPLGSLLRFYISLKLNSLRPAFPLGTFTVNVVGTGLLGMAWDLQRAHLGPGRSVIGGSEIGCQLLQGVADGFCGCLTTVSTWVAELSGLHRWHAYMYGTATVVVSLAVLVVIMGTMKWTVGWNEPVCVTA
ncbi:CrcB-like protein-domain-containing protein [Fusarium sp. MPI-SDFR-AT-0072]|nr:CrcB-like protein-domain-containing protein [Fusarium sp. MPI-SDFR-AT-0072]